jgi:hypothetical protein
MNAMRPSAVVIPALVGVLSLAACGGGRPDHSVPSATAVSGTLLMTGGPSGASQPGVEGQVVFTSDGQHQVTPAAADGTFTTSLAPGTYTVTGTSPQFGDSKGTCRADTSVVVNGTAVAGVVVACSRK